MAKKKVDTGEVKLFCPVNSEGKIVKSCASVQELSGFVLWLNMQDPASQALRLRSYEREGGGKGHASPEAKGSVVEKVCGAFFKSWLLSINAKALTENELGRVDKPYDEATNDELKQARVIFKGLLRSLQEAMFGSILVKADMEPAAVASLTSSLASDGKTFANLVGLLSKHVQEDMESSLAAYWHSERSRSDMKKDKAAATPDRMEKWGLYAPLVHYMTHNLGPSQAAEFMTRFDLYVKSGWAMKDLTTDEHDQNEGLRGFRKLLADLDARPASISGADIEAAVVGRFKELFLPIKINLDAESGAFKDVRKSMAKMMTGTAFDASGMARSGCVDAAIMSVDKSRLFLRFATSDEYMSTQGDQWVRHHYGVAAAVRKGLWEEFGIARDIAIDSGVIAPSAFASHGKFGASVHETLYGNKLSFDAIARLNMVFPLAALSNATSRPEEFPLFGLTVAGADFTAWNDAMKDAATDDPNAVGFAVKRAVCSHVGKAWADFENFKWAKRVGAGASSIGEGGERLVEKMLGFFNCAIEWSLEDPNLQKYLVVGEGQLSGFERFLGSLDPKELSADRRAAFRGVQASFAQLKEQAAKSAKPKPGSKGRPKKDAASLGEEAGSPAKKRSSQ